MAYKPKEKHSKEGISFKKKWGQEAVGVVQCVSISF